MKIFDLLKTKSKREIDIIKLEKTLQEAFRFGEFKDTESRNRAISIYKTILKDYPDCFVAWFNLGVIQSRTGQWQTAIQSFLQSQKSPNLRVVSIFARIKLSVENGKEVLDADLPEEFRGDNRTELGIMGPCHNAANELRNRSYDSNVKDERKNCSIVTKVGAVIYTITLSDLNGLLLKNISREENGQKFNLSNVENLTELDKEFLRLDVGRQNLVQTPISGALSGLDYHRLHEAALSKTGPHGWVQQGRSFEEVVTQQKTEAAQHGMEYIAIHSIEHIARSNWLPGTVFVCVINEEPHAIAMLYNVSSQQFPSIRKSVEIGACQLRGKFFLIPEYPLVHIGLGIPAQSLGDNLFKTIILESAMNFVEANFQSWVSTIEAKKYTKLHVFAPDHSLIVTGCMKLDAEIITSIVDAVDQANLAFKKIPPTSLNFNKAVCVFFIQHPKPFI